MFERFIYRVGKNTALLALETVPGYTPALIARMRKIAGNQINTEFGATALKMKFVANRYVAAAAIFARLVNVAEDTLVGEVRAENWVDAGHAALVLGKCPKDAVAYVFNELRQATYTW